MQRFDGEAQRRRCRMFGRFQFGDSVDAMAARSRPGGNRARRDANHVRKHQLGEDRTSQRNVDLGVAHAHRRGWGLRAP